VEFPHPRAVPLGQQAGQRLPLPLLAMNRPRLGAILVDGEDQAAVAPGSARGRRGRDSARSGPPRAG
jgi:hypothetical protein